MRLVETSNSPLAVTGSKILSGLFAEMDTMNQNNRRYPQQIYEQAYEELTPKIQEKRLLGELDHPIDYDEVRLSNVSHVITECHIEEDDESKKVYGTVELLDTPAGMIAQSLVKAGIPIGISSRGVGATKQVREGDEVTQLKLITYDLVAEPSFSKALLTPTKAKELSDSLSYIESKLPLTEAIESQSIRENITRIRESLLSKKTDPTKEVDVTELEIASLKNLLKESRRSLMADTELLIENRSRMKTLESANEELMSRLKSLNSRMMKFKESYNILKEQAPTEEILTEMQDKILELQKKLAVERRGMAYSSVATLLEGASTEEDIEDRLNSLASLNKKRQTSKVTKLSLTESEDVTPKKLTGLAAIVSKV